MTDDLAVCCTTARVLLALRSLFEQHSMLPACLSVCLSLSITFSLYFILSLAFSSCSSLSLSSRRRCWTDRPGSDGRNGSARTPVSPLSVKLHGIRNGYDGRTERSVGRLGMACMTSPAAWPITLSIRQSATQPLFHKPTDCPFVVVVINPFLCQIVDWSLYRLIARWRTAYWPRRTNDADSHIQPETYDPQ